MSNFEVFLLLWVSNALVYFIVFQGCDPNRLRVNGIIVPIKYQIMGILVTLLIWPMFLTQFIFTSQREAEYGEVIKKAREERGRG